MRDEVRFIPGPLAQGHGIDTFPQELRQEIADPILPPRVDQHLPQARSQPEAVIDLSEEQRAGVGGQPLIP